MRAVLTNAYYLWRLPQSCDPYTGLKQLANVKNINFNLNKSITAEGWTLLMDSLSKSMEKLSFYNCGLDEDKAKPIAIGQGLHFAE